MWQCRCSCSRLRMCAGDRGDWPLEARCNQPPIGFSRRPQPRRGARTPTDSCSRRAQLQWPRGGDNEWPAMGRRAAQLAAALQRHNQLTAPSSLARHSPRRHPANDSHTHCSFESSSAPHRIPPPTSGAHCPCPLLLIGRALRSSRHGAESRSDGRAQQSAQRRR